MVLVPMLSIDNVYDEAGVREGFNTLFDEAKTDLDADAIARAVRDLMSE